MTNFPTAEVIDFIEYIYQVSVFKKVLDPHITGSIDGKSITINCRHSEEVQLFIAAHLFGHLVQWSVDPKMKAIGEANNMAPEGQELDEVIAYEKQGWQLGLGLLHEVGVTNLDQWYSNWYAADSEWLTDFYKTGTCKDYKSFYKQNQPLLEPLPIPKFIPEKFVERQAFMNV